MQQLLVIDDDSVVRDLLTVELRRAGFTPRAASCGAEARVMLDRGRVDLILLDLTLPDEDGFAFCRRLRTHSRVPVIMVTGRKEMVDRIVGLEIGADDYVTKPFHLPELVARVRNVLRRANEEPPREIIRAASRACFAGWTLDFRRRHLSDRENRATILSSIEFQILRVLVTHPGKVLSRERLMELATGEKPEPLQRSIDVHISHLRNKLRDDYLSDAPIITTVRNHGYVLTATVALE